MNLTAMQLIIYAIQCIHGYQNIIKSDKSIMPLGSLKPYENPESRILHEMFLWFLVDFEKEDGFLNIIVVMHKYVNNRKATNQSKISADELGLLYATSIINKFQIGDLCINMLDLLANFDVDLVHHFEVLCEHEIEVIKSAAKIGFENYDYKCYVINRSLSYIALIYATYAHKLTAFQVNQKRWCWKENDHFETLMAKYVINAKITLEYIFQDSKLTYRHDDLTFYDILSRCDILQSSRTRFTKYRDGHRYFVIVYSIMEIFRAIVMSEDSYELSKDSALPMHSILENNKNLVAYDEMFAKAKKDGDYQFLIPHVRGVIKYEFIHGKGKVITEQSFVEWQKQAVLEKKLTDEIFCLLSGRLYFSFVRSY